MAQIDHISDIAFTTEYTIDKITGYYEDSFAIAAATSSGGADVVATASQAHTHGLGYRPYTDGAWSIDNTNWYPFGQALITDIGDLVTPDTLDTLVAVATSSTTDVDVRAYSYDQSARTIYYRVWLIYPEV